MDGAVHCSRKYFDILSDANAYGRRIDYDRILELDAELMQALDQRPAFLRLENLGLEPYHRSSCILVSCTLWHRLFIIHRPFLLLSQSEPERYGLSASRTWEYALLTIRSMRLADARSIVQFPLHFRLMQAALVVISHLFLWPHRLNLRETMFIHDELQYVICTLRNIERSVSGSSMFSGQSRKLEALLAATSKIKRSGNRKRTNHRSSMFLGPRSYLSESYERGNLTVNNPESEDIVNHHSTYSDASKEDGRPMYPLSWLTDIPDPPFSSQYSTGIPALETNLNVLDEQLMRLLRETGAQYLGFSSSPDAASPRTLGQNAATLSQFHDPSSTSNGGKMADNDDTFPFLSTFGQDPWSDILSLLNNAEDDSSVPTLIQHE